MKGIIIALLLVGIIGLALAVFFPALTVLGPVIASVTALLTGIGFLLIELCLRNRI